MKASEITTRLRNDGYEISLRTAQRDLKELSTLFPIELNDKNPRDYGWRWMKGSQLVIPGLSTSEALAMALVETHLQQLIPSSMLDALQGVFSQARAKLEQTSKPSGWLAKVKVVQPTQHVIPPHIDEAAQDTIYKALLENLRIAARYRSVWSDESKEYVLNPLGLIMRGSVSYLVATAGGHEDPRLYAMHRFVEVNILDEGCVIPEGFDIEAMILSGFADFTSSGQSIRLEFLYKESCAALLKETPLSTDQKISPSDDGWVKVSVTVNDTWQLRWWLLSQGADIEVISPKSLRQEIAEELSEASGHYSKSKM